MLSGTETDVSVLLICPDDPPFSISEIGLPLNPFDGFSPD
jgi:hypothetical protein